MAKFYPLTFLLLLSITVLPALGQNNVGIGTNNPQEKLDVNGAIKIGNTSNDFVGTIRYNPPYFEGRNDTGWVQLFGGGGSDNDWIIDGIDMYSGIDGYVGIGIQTPGTKLHVVTDSMFCIAGMSFDTDYGIGVIGIGNGKSPVIPEDGAGGAFIGHYGVFAYTDDSTGVGVFSQNDAGGYAGVFLGDMDFRGAIRNTDDSLYGGSVAVHDGMTVGNIAGASCNPIIPDTASFDHTIGFVPFVGTSTTYANNLVIDTGDCRKITNIRYEVTFFDYEIFGIRANLFIRNQYINTISVSSANIESISPLPNGYINQDSLFGGFYSHWFFNTNIWNGTNPDSISDWYVHCVNFQVPGPVDDDTWTDYRGIISYNFSDSSSAPIYAAFGEIRASGTLYANSTSDYGDVAEFFRVDHLKRKVEPGDIVSISIDQPQTFVLSDKAYDPLIAGVISENPSVFLNDPTAGEPVALTGRVKVKVNAEGGMIKSGDPITSSSVPGMGMKAGKSSIILGHALESFDGLRSENGKIWILLAKGHFEKVNPQIIVKGNYEELKGIAITGSKRVDNGLSEVLVKWSEKTDMEIPDDIEFEDLVVDIMAFGGQAGLSVKEVNKEGFIVAVSNRSEGFQGFYYKVNLVSPKFVDVKYEGENSSDRNNNPKEQDDLTALAKYFEKITGKSLVSKRPITNPEEHKAHKYGVLESWKQADPILFAKFGFKNF